MHEPEAAKLLALKPSTLRNMRRERRLDPGTHWVYATGSIGGPVLYLLVNAVFSSWLSKWGMPRLIPTSPLIRPLHDRRDRSGVLNRRFSSSPGMCRHCLGGSVSEEIATLLIPLWRR